MSDGGLAAAGLPHQTQRLASPNGKVDAVHRMKGAGGAFEILLQVPDFQDDILICHVEVYSGYSFSDCSDR